MTISGLECLLEHYHDDVVDLPDRERGGVEDGRKKAGTCTCQKRGRVWRRFEIIVSPLCRQDILDISVDMAVFLASLSTADIVAPRVFDQSV
jgi:hypothetical protein